MDSTKRDFPRLGRMIAGFAILAATALPAQADVPACAMSPDEIYARLKDRVVEVFSLSIDPFRVYGRITPRIGTGFLIGNGYIATNYHVVGGAEEPVVFFSDEVAPVEIVGVDPALDVAVLYPSFRYILSDPPAGLIFADPGDLDVGDAVYAIGNPMGVGKSLSAGIVSGVSRVMPQTTLSWLSPYIQTDAAVSPGNSGGPLIDACGRVAGMVSAGIYEEGAENLGFAIPVEVLRPVLDELIAEGKVARPWHGLYGQMTFPPVLMMLGVPPDEWEESSGFLVETIEPGSAADRAGLLGGRWPVMWGGTQILLGGDIITSVNGVRIESQGVALDFVKNLKIGDTVHLEWLREGAPMAATVTLEERPFLADEAAIYHRAQERE